MVDYIINGIRLDYALLLNAAGFDLDAQMRTAMNEGATSIASIFAAKSKEWDNVLSEFCASFGE